jgi:hypothetical protein
MEDQNLPQGSEQPLEPATGAETGLQQSEVLPDGSDGEPGNGDASADTGATDLDAAGTDEPVDPQHSHQSVLSMLLADLEGMIHMSKTEIIAQVDKARKLFESL